jgi:glycolate oxidase
MGGHPRARPGSFGPSAPGEGLAVSAAARDRRWARAPAGYTARMTAVATDTLAAELGEIVGEDHVRADAGGRVAYSTDATPEYQAMPDAVAFPASTEEVAAILRLANERRVPVVRRGAGTNLSAGVIPIHGGIVLVLTRMSRLLELDPANLAAVCQPGLRTSALSDAAAAEGLLYPPDPGSRTTSTLGGNVSENAGGLRGLKYGVTRDYVLGVEAVLATGEVIAAAASSSRT